MPRGLALVGSASESFTRPVRLRFAYPSRVKDEIEAESLRKGQLWAFRSKVVRVDDAAAASRNEVLTRVKHKVLSQERAFGQMARAVELFEKLERAPAKRRVPIPEAVRLLVWRRDGGKCTTCGSQERLEFDHIIPVDRGGSSTARNIQLLCERCNRQKGASI